MEADGHVLERSSSITRRRALLLLGAAGGAGLTLGAMEVLGLLPPSRPPTSTPFRAPCRADFALTGRASASVLILGAGIAGLAATYELEKAGYRCEILEARDRPGGRNWTARTFTSETATDGITQTCLFDAGLYMNVGPTRIAQHHTTLQYCRELGIPVHVFGNQNVDTYYYVEGAGPLSGRPIRRRAVEADRRGYLAELLAKAINQGALDQDLTAADAEALLEFFRATGVLSAQNRYVGSPARGYPACAAPGAGLQAGAIDPPFRLSDLLQLSTTGAPTGALNLGLFLALFEYDWHQAMPMFEPDGGMDRIPTALAHAIRGPIRYGA